MVTIPQDMNANLNLVLEQPNVFNAYFPEVFVSLFNGIQRFL